MDDVVWVVCGNDYPDAAFTTEAKAEAYVAKRKAQALNDRDSLLAPRIYWRTYAFRLDDKDQG